MKAPRPLSWQTSPLTELKKIKGICFDIDDTFSTEGKIHADAFSALWKLKEAGYVLVPVTGRPAGWCDHISRFWPVDAVVGENGAFTFFIQNGKRKRLDTLADSAEFSEYKNGLSEPGSKLHRLAQKIQTQFPQAQWASDQNYREYDLAIDFCEDVPAWPKEQITQLIELCENEGAHAKLSSIHVNTWYGDFDKRKGFERWLSIGAPGIEGEIPKWNEWLFIGDSPNDEPLFAAFSYSVGVANLSNYLDQLKNPPQWITQTESGYGFSEMAERLLLANARPL